MAFCVVAILNCGGYRYGVGDQAFYIPAVTQHLNPDLFPRDRAILHAQDRFMLYDDAIAVFVRATGVSVQAVFFAGYLAGLVLLSARVAAIGRCSTEHGSRSRCWPRSSLASTSASHKQAPTRSSRISTAMLAFALGAWAIAAYLRGRIAAPWRS